MVRACPFSCLVLRLTCVIRLCTVCSKWVWRRRAGTTAAGPLPRTPEPSATSTGGGWPPSNYGWTKRESPADRRWGGGGWTRPMVWRTSTLACWCQ
ncbi:hypothetical protein BC832DRAFT_622737 [Gaertneriomyces semiglobifer]|nr:hypothetical protein BC832DRAFT_622737 [Gaertneriomyces semiglobifer]